MTAKKYGGFEPVQYWLERHEKYRGDIRSVGNLSLPPRTNKTGDNAFHQQLVDFLPSLFGDDANGRSVLDLGAGIGRVAPVFIKLGFDYTGLELSPVAIEQALQKVPEGRFIQGNIADFQPERRYDIVFSAYVLNHVVHDKDWQATLKMIASAVKGGGYFLLVEAILEEPFWQAAHSRTRSFADYELALKEVGLLFPDPSKSPIEKLYVIRPE